MHSYSLTFSTLAYTISPIDKPILLLGKLFDTEYIISLLIVDDCTIPMTEA